MSVASGCYKPSKNGSKGKKQASRGKCQLGKRIGSISKPAGKFTNLG